MATCPSGCGRKVSFSTRGAAAGASLMERMLSDAGVAHVVAIVENADGLADELGDLIDTGDQIECWLLAHVHKEARPGTTPDVLTLTKMLGQWREAFSATLVT